MYPLLLEIGDFVISSHDFFLSLGFFVGTAVLFREIRLDHEHPAKVLNLAIYMIIFAIIGARLFHVVIEAPAFYLKNPLNIFKIWNGGWTFYGGLLADIIFAIFYMKKQNMNPYRTIDMFAPAVTLGLSYGRMACYMAGCCYGKVCPPDFPMASTFKVVNMVRPQASPLNTPLYPTQLAEAILALGLFFFMIFYRKRKKFHGELAAIFLIVYGIARFLIEYFRADDIRGLWLGGTISTSQIISLPLIGIGMWLFLRNKD